MSYPITNVECKAFPTDENVERELMSFGLSIDEMVHYVKQFVCQADLEEKKGYQTSISRELPIYLKQKLEGDRGLAVKDNRYTPKLRENADLVVGIAGRKSSIYFEIEFRPNVEKDLIKFQIGQNSQTLSLGVLIVALAWKEINGKYYTMPEYEKIVRLVEELSPTYPLLILGITGSHIAPPVAV